MQQVVISYWRRQVFVAGTPSVQHNHIWLQIIKYSWQELKILKKGIGELRRKKNINNDTLL